MKYITDLDVKGKRVLVRCDFNVPLNKNGTLEDDFRIERTLPTIKYLIENKAKVILMSHLGNPDGTIKKGLSLLPVQKRLSEDLGILPILAEDCVGKKTEGLANKLQEGRILLLENLRFHKEETENDLDFAKALSELGEIFINDGFSVSHREHASIVGIPKFLPSAAGFLFKEEFETLSKILKKPKKPLVGIIGGAKLNTKIKPIKNFLEKVDFLLIGGKIANAIFEAKGIIVGKPLPEEEVLKEIEKLDLTNPKLRLPVDATIALDNVYVRNAGPASARRDELALDIGAETIKIFSQIIGQAKTIFWAGPLGKVEEKQFAIGSLQIARAIGESKAFSVAGGNDTISFLREYNLADKFSYLSTAGGAMLDFLSDGSLVGIEALEELK